MYSGVLLFLVVHYTTVTALNQWPILIMCCMCSRKFWENHPDYGSKCILCVMAALHAPNGYVCTYLFCRVFQIVLNHPPTSVMSRVEIWHLFIESV